ncbi:MAG: elongation factor P [Cytophagales bacterium]|nr:elongation factor P [Cytophagales bacterium]
MATTADFKKGIYLSLNQDIYQLVEFQHVKPGKGGAFVRTKLKNLSTGRITDQTFNAGVKIDIIRIERHPYQYLYQEGNVAHLMHLSTFEQNTIPLSKIEGHDFMKEGQELSVTWDAARNIPLQAELPPMVELKVTQTEPGLRGDTANSPSKPATLETGVIVQVPLFVNAEEIVRVDTRTGKYQERVR